MKNVQNIASQLLQGSRNIDRMREEIEQLIPMLYSQLKNEMIQTGADNINWNWKFGLDDNEWDVSCQARNQKDDCEIMISYTISKGGGKTIYLHRYETLKGVVSWNIQAIYEALPVLVEGIFKELPRIEDAMSYILDASTVVL